LKNLEELMRSTYGPQMGNCHGNYCLWFSRPSPFNTTISKIRNQIRLTLLVVQNSSIRKEVKREKMKFIFITLAAFFALVLSSPVPEATAESDPNYFLSQPFEDGELSDYPEALANLEVRQFHGRFRPPCVCFVSPCSCFGRPWGK
jgi:hypothetical protein